MRNIADTLISRTFFDDTYEVSVVTIYDEDPQFDYLGEFVSSMDWNPDIAVYHRRSGLMYDGTHWKDENGKFAAEPEALGSYWCKECQFISVSDMGITKGEKNWLKYAFQNAKRLDRIDNYWWYLGVVAEIKKNGHVIGYGSCWGVESDCGDEHINKLAKEVLYEAFTDAKQTLTTSKTKELQHA